MALQDKVSGAPPIHGWDKRCLRRPTLEVCGTTKSTIEVHQPPTDVPPMRPNPVVNNEDLKFADQSYFGANA
jgi:hypothetical protein